MKRLERLTFLQSLNSIKDAFGKEVRLAEAIRFKKYPGLFWNNHSCRTSASLQMSGVVLVKCLALDRQLLFEFGECLVQRLEESVPVVVELWSLGIMILGLLFQKKPVELALRMALILVLRQNSFSLYRIRQNTSPLIQTHKRDVLVLQLKSLFLPWFERSWSFK